MTVHLTLIGGPAAQPRQACDAKLTAPVLSIGGVRYLRQATGDPCELVYRAEDYCEHEGSDWRLVHHGDGRAPELWRVCVLCPVQEWEPFSLPV